MIIDRILASTSTRLRRLLVRTQRNLFMLYRPLLDTLHFFDNSSDTPRLIFRDEAGRTIINDAVLYERLQKEFAP